MSVLRFIIHSSKPYRLCIGGMFLAICIIAIDANIKPYLIKILIDSSSHSNYEMVLCPIMIYIVSQFTMVFSWNIFDSCDAKYTPRYRMAIANIFVDSLNQYSYNFFQSNLSGSITAKISKAFDTIPRLIRTIIVEYINFLLRLAITLVVLARVSPVFPLGMALWVSVFVIITLLALKRAEKRSSQYSEIQPQIYGHLADYFSNIFNVICFNTYSYEKTKLAKIGDQLVERSNRLSMFFTNFYSVQGTIASLYGISLIFILIFLSVNKVITSGDFFIVFMLNFGVMDMLFRLSSQLREFVNDWGAVDQALTLLNPPEDVTIIEAGSRARRISNLNKPAVISDTRLNNAISDEGNIVDEQQERDLKKKGLKIGTNILRVSRGGIVFDDVSFSYKGTAPIFQNESVIIAPGQKVGLVGYSGGGKSTFVNLILRLYKLDSGHIFIDGQDISQVTKESLRSAIGIIPQDPVLFHRTIMENIRYGKLDATDAEVVIAAERAGAHDFISKLPKFYDSLVGERGVKLSGGQRQRIAIARAILKNAPILILDEATSQLDSITESNVYKAIWRLIDIDQKEWDWEGEDDKAQNEKHGGNNRKSSESNDSKDKESGEDKEMGRALSHIDELSKDYPSNHRKTTIVIAHRLSTVLRMDRILVFDRGKIAEDGTHQELLDKNGLYKALWDAQIGGFLPE